ncbi:type VI secretion system-associated FHA domain protein TagH [Rhodovarius sp.]|uniref:type VI secretion system-associated FHA domain protein TagH n=1 Tax=Rhodovarius sp. TaxID=2972673 RepID=UPI0034A44F69
MVLMLTILRCPDAAVPEQRMIQGGEYTLGRGPECDWTLLDPERVLSKRHCAVEFLRGDWQLRDLSTNGTFLNSAVEPIGRNQVLPLRDGDRVRLGVYEIECRVVDEAQHASGRGHVANAIPDPMAPPRPHRDIFSVPLPGLSPPDAGAADGHAPFLPVDFDPFAPADPGPVMPDHRPSTKDVFTPPRAHMPDILPDDWNATPLPSPAAKAVPLADPFAALPDPFADAPPGSPPHAPAGGDPHGSDPFASAPFCGVPVHPMAPPVAAAPERDATAAHAAMDAQQAALALLFQGAGLGTPPPGLDPAAALTAAGASLRVAVEGMRQLLIARADVKREFRIEQTMLRAAGNNPVKFAATVDAAMLALLAGPGAACGIGNAAALRETVDDLNVHQVATLSATQAAARALLGRLAPEPLEAETSSGGIIPGARERRLWESYKKLHRQMIDQFDDDFDSAFGKAFARAYEEASRGG